MSIWDKNIKREDIRKLDKNKEVDILLPVSDNKKTKIWPLVVIFDLIFVV